MRSLLLLSFSFLLGLGVLACSDGDPADVPSGSGGRDAPGSCEGVQSCAGGAGGASGCVETDLRLEFLSFPLGASGVTDFVFLPERGGRFLFTASSGSLFMGRLDGDSVSVLHEWEIPDTILAEAACGLANVLLDPEFDEQGGFIYVSYCTSETNTRLVRYTWSEGGGLSDQAVIFETELAKPIDTWHRFGSMGFEEDKKTLWMLVGDHFSTPNGQSPQTPMGSVVRIEPSRKAGEGGFLPATGNMAEQATADADPSVFAIGLRSPWRGTRDSSGRIFIGDVGLVTFEEVNLLTEVGQNFGWGTHEGPCQAECDGFSDPLVYYGRESDEPYVLDDPDTSPAFKRAIWVGEIYQEPTTDRYCGLMDDVVVFGDLFTGWVRGLRASQAGELSYDRSIGHLGNVTAWRKGADGYGYALTLDGTLHRALLKLPPDD